MCRGEYIASQPLRQPDKERPGVNRAAKFGEETSKQTAYKAGAFPVWS